MKILRVASDLYPYVVGGVTLHVHDLSKDQSESGYEVTIYTCFSDVTGEIEPPANYTIQNFGRDFVIAGNTISPKMFLDILKNCNTYDIVHAHSHLYFSTLLCALIRRFRKFNLVITNHGLISQTVPDWFQKMYNATAGRFIFSSADLVITYTKEEGDLIASWEGRSDNIRIIHNGIKVERFLTPLHVSKKKQILWIGRYVPGKGAKYLLEGFAVFTQNHPEYSVLMIGRGPEKELMRELTEQLGIADKVTMVDFFPNTELQKIYEESTVFVSASLAEGVPKTMLEAMICGLPVISTNLPQLVDIVDGCGLIVPCMDSQAIADAMEMMISHPDLMKYYGENARHKVLTSYDWKDTVQKTNEVFENLIKS